MKSFLAKKGLSRRLLFLILLCSTAFTLFATIFQLALDYRDQVESVHRNLDYIEASYVPAFAQSLYELNEEQLRIQMTGAWNLEDIVYLKIEEEGQVGSLEVEIGSLDYSDLILRKYELEVPLQREPYYLGRLYVGATTDQIRETLLIQAVRIFAINGVKVLAASLLIFFIIQQVVTRHLVSMVRYTDKLNLDSLDREPLDLHRGDVDDELTHLTVAVNEMRKRLAREIKDHKASEEERAQLLVDLKQAEKLQAVGELAGGIAHDFNNQLHVIQGSTEVLRSILEGNEDVDEFTSQILKSCERSSRLITHMMMFSRKNSSVVGDVSANEVVQEVISILRLGSDNHLEYSCSLESQHPQIRGDVAQIQSALLNLGLNAKDACPKGGQIHMCTSDKVITEPALSLLGDAIEPGSYVCISVEDDGEGIPQSLLQKIFEPFFTTKDIGKGTGMGLSAVYGMALAHGGWIDVVSSPGLGTRFDLYLPRNDHESDEAAED